MPFRTQKIPNNDTPFNHQDFDSDVSRVASPNYLRASNITFITDEGQTQNSIEITRGNKRYISIPTTAFQNKAYRITGYLADSLLHTNAITVTAGNIPLN